MLRNIAPSRPAVIHERAPFGGRLVENIVRRIRADDARLPLADQQFLKDILRGRYSLLSALPRLLDLCARCQSDEAALALVEEVSAHVAAKRVQGTLPLADAIVAEDTAEYTANVAVREYTLTRSPGVARVACERLYAHERRIARLRQAFAVVAAGGFR